MFERPLGTKTPVSDEEVQQKIAHAKFQVDRTSLDKRGGRGGGLKKGFHPKLFLLHYEFTHYAFSLSLFMEICIIDMQELRFKEWGCQKPETGRKSAGRGLKPT